MTRDERLMAYVDGELSAADRAAFEQVLADDPGLKEEVARQQRLRRRLAAAFDPILDEPAPLALTLAAQTANAPRRGWSAQHWAAMAACAVAGVLAGQAFLAERGPLTVREGGLAVRGELAAALERKLAAEPGPVQVGLSFRDTTGRYCRTFKSADDQLAGVACREANGWTAAAVSAWRPAGAPTYRTAGSETPSAVLAAVDGLISGAPLDAAAERAARDKGWTP